MKEITRLWKEYMDREIKFAISILTILTLVLQLCNVAPSYIVGQITNLIQQGGQFNIIVNMALVLFATKMLTTGISLIFDRIDIQKVTFDFSRKLKILAYEKLIELPLGEHLSSKSDKRNVEINKGISAVENIFSNSMFTILPNILICIISIVGLWILYPQFAWISSLCVFIFGYTVWRNIKYSTPKRRRWRKNSNERDSLAQEIVRNLPDIQVSQGHEIFSLFNRRTKKSHDHGKRLFWIFQVRELFVDIPSAIITSGLLLYGAWSASHGKIGVGDMFVIFSWNAMATGRFTQLMYMIQRINKDMVDVEQFVQIINSKPKDSSCGTRKVWLAKEPIHLTDVTYKYPGAKENALCGVSTTINPGDFVAFIGKSGVGKSTIVKLLLQADRPTGGEIHVGDTPLHEADRRILLQQIAYVPQTKMLFDLTLRQNLLLGIPEDEIPDDEEIVAVLQKLGLEKFADKLHLNIGENGNKLSGGEKQRAIIARIFLRRGVQLVIFDEPTSDLDAESEHLIQQALLDLPATKIMIAHRLTTIRHADTIHLLENGQITHSGSHIELLKISPTYARMVEKNNIAV